MFITVLLGFIVALFCSIFGKWIRIKSSFILSILPFGLFLYFIQYIPLISSGETLRETRPWVESMGLYLDFYLDGLSLLFSLMITGIGTLIFVYASNYLKGHPMLDRFYGYLSLFMAAMLGLVLSNNALLLFIFWELTSISSFFLIGFNNDDPKSRKSALIALGITGGGGFFLMGGLVLLGHLAGTYSIQDMLSSNEFLKAHALYPVLFFMIILGAFTKSAQFPFQFWLPGAMKAPTPVSAYLHSATMVKAGVFLLARIFPVIGGTDLWMYTLIIIGGLTMLIGAFHSIFKTDMKSVLAYTTISALGVLVFLLGIGTKEALYAASAFILVHALYKATLFLVTGIIDHETGTRDLTQLRGLRKVLMPVSISAFLAAISSAGVPLTFGFIGKDMIYEATLAMSTPLSILLTAAAVLTNIFLLCGGFLAGIRPFFGRLPAKFEEVHMPSPLLWVPPLILATLGIVFGLFPSLVGDHLIGSVAASISNLTDFATLKIWHGFNLVLLLSGITLLLGTALYYITVPSYKIAKKFSGLTLFTTESLFKKSWAGFLTFANKYSFYWHNGYLRSYLFKILLSAVLILSYKLFLIGDLNINWEMISPITIYEVVVSLVLIAGVYLTITTVSRLTAVVATSVIGYCICLLFVFYSAPDLALTQFSIDTLTVVLFVLVLFRLPPFLNFAKNSTKIRDSILSVWFGVVIAMTALHVLHEPTENTVSKYYGDNAYLLAKGKNVVNVILVDFRGIDTMFEIVVLGIAAIGVYSLLKLRLKPSERE